MNGRRLSRKEAHAHRAPRNTSLRRHPIGPMREREGVLCLAFGTSEHFLGQGCLRAARWALCGGRIGRCVKTDRTCGRIWADTGVSAAGFYCAVCPTANVYDRGGYVVRTCPARGSAYVIRRNTHSKGPRAKRVRQTSSGAMIDRLSANP